METVGSADDHARNAQQASSIQSAELVLEVPGDHVADFSESIPGLPIGGDNFCPKHAYCDPAGSLCGATETHYADQRSGQPNHGREFSSWLFDVGWGRV